MKTGHVFAIFIAIISISLAIIFLGKNQKTNQTNIQKGVSSTTTINGNVFQTEVARTDKERRIGLSKYDSLPENKSMLFVFDQPGYFQFWMKDMKFPIDIIFILDKKVVYVVKNAPIAKTDAELKQYHPDSPANYVLEINAGLSEKYNIKKGDMIKFDLK